MGSESEVKAEFRNALIEGIAASSSIPPNEVTERQISKLWKEVERAADPSRASQAAKASVTRVEKLLRELKR